MSPIAHSFNPAYFTRHAFDRWNERYPKSGSVYDAYARAVVKQGKLIDELTGVEFVIVPKSKNWLVVTVLPPKGPLTIPKFLSQPPSLKEK